jgi:threonine aldolase
MKLQLIGINFPATQYQNFWSIKFYIFRITILIILLLNPFSFTNRLNNLILMIIDLRSDTVTRPDKDMLQAMMEAKVGDDVFDEDPTVNALEEKISAMFNKEAALFCPSGTMTNQIAIKTLTEPLQELICDKLSHIYYYEGGGIAFNSGVSVRLIDGNRGRISASDIIDNINPDNSYQPVTSLVCLENTSNKGGGSYYEKKSLEEISSVCRKNQLKLHLDGARLFNALIEANDEPSEIGKLFDTISICLSKGLGAPVGSLLLSSKENIKKARRVRKVFGGGMRQAGFLAAAGIYALENNIKRLKEDHSRAKQIGVLLKSLNFVEEIFPVETNIIVFRLADKIKSEVFINKLRQHKILVVPFGKQLIRMVTHLDFDDVMLEALSNQLKTLSIV